MVLGETETNKEVDYIRGKGNLWMGRNMTLSLSIVSSQYLFKQAGGAAQGVLLGDTVEPVRPEIPLLNYYNKKHEKYILTTGKNGLD